MSAKGETITDEDSAPTILRIWVRFLNRHGLRMFFACCYILVIAWQFVSWEPIRLVDLAFDIGKSSDPVLANKEFAHAMWDSFWSTLLILIATLALAFESLTPSNSGPRLRVGVVIVVYIVGICCLVVPSALKYGFTIKPESLLLAACLWVLPLLLSLSSSSEPTRWKCWGRASVLVAFGCALIFGYEFRPGFPWYDGSRVAIDEEHIVGAGHLEPIPGTERAQPILECSGLFLVTQTTPDVRERSRAAGSDFVQPRICPPNWAVHRLCSQH